MKETRKERKARLQKESERKKFLLERALQAQPFARWQLWWARKNGRI